MPRKPKALCPHRKPLNGLCPDCAAETRERAIQASLDHAHERWLKEAAYAIDQVRQQRGAFTADHVWEWLNQYGVESTHEPSALGPVVREAADRGLIRQTGEMRWSQLRQRHRKLTEWETTGAKPFIVKRAA